MPDGVDAEAALKTKKAGEWTLVAVPRPLAVEVERRVAVALADKLKSAQEGPIAYSLIKQEMRKLALIDLRGKEEVSKEEAAKLRVMLPEAVIRELWLKAQTELKAKDVEAVSKEDLGKLLLQVAAKRQADLDDTIGQVTPAEMEEFLSKQFFVHGDIPNVEVSRRNWTEPGELMFDVTAEVRGGAKGWTNDVHYFFGSWEVAKSEPLGKSMFFVQDKLVNVIGASITLLVAVILTGFFIPNMLRKGSLDLLVAKPMARWELLLYKYLGGLIFMLLISGLTVGGVWLVMAVRSGNWNPTFLLTIPLLTFTFAVLYAISTLVAVLTRSAIAAILVAAFFMAVLGVVGLLKTTNDLIRSATAKEEDKKNLYYSIVDGCNAVLPRYNDLLKINSRAMAEAYTPLSNVRTEQRNEMPSWYVAFGISLAYIAGFLSLAYLRFTTRDP